MAIVILEGPVITAGESLSSGLDCSAGQIVKITFPFTWTHADITFASSSDGNFYNDLMHPNGLEISCAVFPGTAVIGLGLVRGFIKIRTGSRDRPVIQTEDRSLRLRSTPGRRSAADWAADSRLRHKFGG